MCRSDTHVQLVWVGWFGLSLATAGPNVRHAFLYLLKTAPHNKTLSAGIHTFVYSPGAELGPYAFNMLWIFFGRKFDYNLGFKKNWVDFCNPTPFCTGCPLKLVFLKKM